MATPLPAPEPASPAGRRPAKGKPRRGWLRKLRNRYRLLLINDATFEERFSMRLTRLNVLLLFLAIWLALAAVWPRRAPTATALEAVPAGQKRETGPQTGGASPI